MVNFVKNYPGQVNRDLLIEELAGFGFVFRQDHFEVIGALAEDEATIDGIIAGHVHTQKTAEQQLAEDSAMTKAQIKDYLRAQLVNPSALSNLATIKTTLETAVSGNTNITQAISNIASLYGYDDATDAGYVRCALLVVPLLIE